MREQTSFTTLSEAKSNVTTSVVIAGFFEIQSSMVVIKFDSSECAKMTCTTRSFDLPDDIISFTFWPDSMQCGRGKLESIVKC